MRNKTKITGIYNVSKSGDFGFVDVVGENKGYYVFYKNKKDALPGDEVLAEVNIFKGRKEAKIIKVLKRSDNTFVGEFQFGKNNSYGFVIIDDDSFKQDVFIAGKFLGKVKNKDIVGVKIIGWKNKSPEGKIVEILGKKGDRGLFVNGLILGAGFSQKFPHRVNSELKRMSSCSNLTSPHPSPASPHSISPKGREVEQSLIPSPTGRGVGGGPKGKRRKDLRNLFTFTIDGEDAKDLDDAISINKRKNGNFELFVHIADVSNYVQEKSYLDKEALKRGTSVYLADRVIPMLPELLSNNLCSLNPDSDKLTMTCEMLIGKDGAIKKIKVYESIIKSDFRLTYKEVEEMKNNSYIFKDKKLFCNKKITDKLLEKMQLSWELKNILGKNKKLRGSLDFDFPETKIIFNSLSDKKNQELSIKEIKQYPKYESNEMIEFFMVAANYSVSKFFSDLPFLYRIHPEPSDDDVERLQKILNIFGLEFVIKKLTTKEFQGLLDLINKHPAKKVLEKKLLRSLSKAIYSTDNEGHFGLGLDYYSHFTSPIRRYPDLQIHRIIKEKLSGKLTKKRIEHYKNILENIATHCSTQEIKAEKLEYKVRDYYIVQFYKDKLGKIFDGIIISMIDKGFFVQLKDTSEGFVSIDGAVYNSGLMQFEDIKNKKIYKMGDEIKVKLMEADEKMLRLNFELV